MPYEIFVGLRYLRAKRRTRTISLNTGISITGITLGVAALIGTLGIMTGFQEDLQAKILGTTSHIVIQTQGQQPMAGYTELIHQVERVPGVVAATPYLVRQILLTSRNGVQGIVLRGIDPEKEPEVTDVAHNVTVGTVRDLATPSLPAPPDSGILPGMILGKELAARLGVFVGGRVNVVSPVGPVRATGMTPKIRPFQVVGLFASGMYEYDASLAYVALNEAQKFFGFNGTVTGIEVKIEDVLTADTIASRINAALGTDYLARDWMELNRNLFSALRLEKTMMFLLLVLITLVASFNIVGTLAMIVNDKQREIAILKAMGATPNAIMRIFMLNGLVIGLTGTAIGIPLGYAFLYLIEQYWTFDQTVYYLSHISVHVKAVDVLLVSCSAVLISFAATLYPSWQAATLTPVSAIRYAE
ncbi:MAG: lipoprotein-releasing ABC transporter permease subunit [Nitrospira sp.]|nr:lipoprotein-releasing ABC transporter permease subunit [Nitrospira sp.]MDD9859686.1 lipoprotein-releasing ABC transporter permease subunit [Nitrospira sp.]